MLQKCFNEISLIPALWPEMNMTRNRSGSSSLFVYRVSRRRFSS